MAPSRRPKEQARAEEAQALLTLAGPKDFIVALDERGVLLGSEQLSQVLAKAQTQGKDLLVLIGGDEGLDETVRQKAHLVLSLSKMTLPHRLARVLILEQLYRGFTLLRGEPYHK